MEGTNYKIGDNFIPTVLAALRFDLFSNESYNEWVLLADQMTKGGIQSPSKQLQLSSIFSCVGTLRGKQTDMRLPITAMAPVREAIFPKEKSANPMQDAAVLKEKIKESFANPSGDPQTDLEHALFALERYSWSLSSSGETVSLYDLARTRASIALCLMEISELPEHWEISDAPAGLLVGGEFSGIQKFIYTITDKEAAKSLRGRSFFMQVLTESVLRFILTRLGIPYTQVIYAGGGNFYLLTPLSAEDRLPEIHQSITKSLLKHFGIDLYLTLGSTPISFNEFKNGNFGDAWGRMHREISLNKSHRYTELGEEIYPLLFEPAAHGGNQDKVCDLCSIEKADTAKSGDIRVCRACAAFAEDFGKNLPFTAYVRFILGKTESREPGSIDDALAEFGVGIDLLDARGEILGEPSPFEGERAFYWSIRGGALPKEPLPAALRCHFIANKRPDKLFDELIRSEDGKGIARLGVLRMDVDNMGKLFRHGFAEDISFSRLASLSQQLSLFFEGYIRQLCETYRDAEGEDAIYIVYTGGDDVFLLGYWSTVLDLAEAIHREFKTYTCENPDISISGGMTFIQGKYPLRQAALDAGEAESLAKDYHHGEKNAFAFLGEAFSWQDFTKLRKMKERLTALEDKGAPRSLLQLLLHLDQQKTEAEGREYGRWLWMGDYHFSRMLKQYKNTEDLAQELKALWDSVRLNYYQDLHLWGKAARWAQLELSESDREEEQNDIR